MDHIASSSESTFNTSPTVISGPSPKEPAFISSKWGIGWKTPAVMLASYVLAIGIAVGHLLFFQHIDGKEADGAHQIVSQSYVSTASNILANGYGYALRSALAIAFAQYLWRLFRVSALKVSTIEDLFLVRANPLLLLKGAVLRATPFLCSSVLLMWALQVAIGFPPGAITVVTRQKISYNITNIPSYNASFMGNGSGTDAETYALITLAPDTDSDAGFITGAFNEGKNGNLINRLARQVLISGEPLPMTSPCGLNCSYMTVFEAPWFNCSNLSTTYAISSNLVPAASQIFISQWYSPSSSSMPLTHPGYNGTHTQALLNTSTLAIMSVNYTTDPILGPQLNSAVIRQDNLTCTPGRARYTINNTYENNVHSRKVVSAVPIDILTNLALRTHDNVVIVPGFNADHGSGYGTRPANWSAAALAYYRDNNMMAIFSSMASWLDGHFDANLQGYGLPHVGNISTDPHWQDVVSTQYSGVSISAGANGTIADSTRLNAVFGTFSASGVLTPQFSVSQEVLNDYMLNMTTSIMVAYGMWPTTANATISTPINVYSFSRPLMLLIPYFLSLALAVPFILMGVLALVMNGVSAIDGGFMQTITTSTGSAVLDRAAAGGCLGGEESVPKELKDLKVRFGEFIGRQEPGRIRRAGFGVETEVTALEKGALYGIARWI
ncbi:hypothetical protein LSUB1_G000574 [Lachnellula subtilissima]|uniref:Uncharacterized protein n=1 Tax=Lachnellula subtilissima TaxID=602034 RepID=A0A8H8S1W9_9HELO|nr:hypothetical protein LSUB1_G000574 [Lachnellula subtilissima]